MFPALLALKKRFLPERIHGHQPNGKQYTEITFARDWLAFLILGTINNYAYVVVISAAKELASSFPGGQLGVITAANVAAGGVVRTLNTFALERVPFWMRLLFNTVIMALGLLGVAFSLIFPSLGFGFCVASIILIGASSSFGESVFLGFIRSYPPDTVGGWSSGTGWAGVLGASVYVLMNAVFHLSNQAIFLLQLPLVAIYFATYLWGLSPGLDTRTAEEGSPLMDEGVVQRLEPVRVPFKVAARAWIERMLRAGKLVASPAFQLGLVYWFEYVVSTGFAEHAVSSKPNDFWHKNAYEILSWCYQVGVLISRSSLPLIRIQKLWILTSLQGMNFVLWLMQVLLMAVPVGFLFPAMVFVGLMGGAAYVNTFMVIHSTVGDEDRDLCANMAALAIFFGILGSSVFTVIMDSTWEK